jgi:fermentation-respiration switch protein FrsA (DUF1100 family)
MSGARAHRFTPRSFRSDPKRSPDMVHRLRPIVFVLLCATLLSPTVTRAAGVQAVFDVSPSTGSPSPSDRFTVSDPSQLTGVRVNLPKPDCLARPSDCQDIDVINTLDGFNLQPRLTVRFTGPIDPATVTSDAVFLVSLGDARGSGAVGQRVGINQVVWDPATGTLALESDELLDQHTRYALVVTDGVRDAAGDAVEAGAFARFRHDLNFGQTKDPALKAYRKALLDALAAAAVPASRVVTASVFTTGSASADLEKIRNQIKASTPAAATILGDFPLADVTGISFVAQVTTVPSFVSVPVPIVALGLFPGAVGRIAFGKYESPDYETSGKFIPATGTLTGSPAVQATNEVHFNLIVPAGAPPAGGWPVAIFGHGFGDNKNNSPFVVASTMAAHGIATIAINVVGHGFGPAGVLVVNRVSGGPVTLAAGGRGIDQDGNGTIDSTEGVSAAPPRAIISSRDGLRQTVVDLMQLVRVIETGGITGLDRSRIYYFGQSFGGIYGTMLLGVEPGVRAGVVNVPGGAIIEIVRLSPVFRILLTLALASRVPPLLNDGPIVPPLFGFDENLPLRNQPPVVNTVPGALAIQEVIEQSEWVSQSGNPVAYAPHVRLSPLPGMTAKPVIVQFANGDQTVPNPTATALIRAGDLADRATYFRNDLAFAANPATPKNPHTFLTRIATPSVAAFAVGAQQQIAIFFETDGLVTIDPDGAGPFFEVPIAGPLPETLNFIP